MVLLARAMVHPRWLVAGDGGTAEPRRELPATASHGWLHRARYELHGHAGKLKEAIIVKEMAPS